MRDHLLVGAEARHARAELVQVVEQAPSLVLFDVESGQPQQTPLVVPGIHDLRLDRDLRAVAGGLDGHLADVETEGVQPVHAFGDAPGLVDGERLLVGEGAPQRVVRRHQAVGDGDGIHTAFEPTTGLEVHDLAGDVGAGDVEVVCALARSETVAVQFARLGVDEVRGELARVAAEQRVRQRHVAPVEPHVVQAHEQDGQGVDQARGRVRTQDLGEQRAVRERELQVRGDQRRRERAARGVGAPRDHGDPVDARRRETVEVAEHVVLAPSHLLGRLLDRDDATGEVREPDEVPRDALGEGHDVRARPVGEAGRPGQLQQSGVDRAGGDAEGFGHGSSGEKGAARGVVEDSPRRDGA